MFLDCSLEKDGGKEEAVHKQMKNNELNSKVKRRAYESKEERVYRNGPEPQEDERDELLQKKEGRAKRHAKIKEIGQRRLLQSSCTNKP